MDWKTVLAYISGSVDEELLLRNEYLIAENRILRHQLKGRVQLTDVERATLAEIGKKLGKQALEEVANIVKPETILGWHRKLAAEKCDGSDQRKSLGRPRVDKELEELTSWRSPFHPMRVQKYLHADLIEPHGTRPLDISTLSHYIQPYG